MLFSAAGIFSPVMKGVLFATTVVAEYPHRPLEQRIVEPRRALHRGVRFVVVRVRGDGSIPYDALRGLTALVAELKSLKAYYLS